MDGSPESTPHSTGVRRLFALLALTALIATACGGNTESRTSTAPANASQADYAGWGAEDKADEPTTTADTRTAVDPSYDDVDLGSPTPSDGHSPTGEGAPVEGPPAVAQQSAQVLAYAIEASEELSYSFEQGMSMKMSMLGIDLDVAPADAFVTGEVSGEDSHVRADIGVFMMSMFESLGIDPDDPLFASMLGDFGSMSMEVWTVDGSLIIDMSGLVSSLGSIDPAAAGEMGVFAEGPVKVDLEALAALGGADAGSIMQQYGQGAQVTDPAALIDALRLVDAVAETGTSTVGSIPVTVYEASLSMADYYAALGMDITDQLGSMEDLGFGDGSDEAALAEAIAPAIQNLVVDMKIMLDDDGLVRRMETNIDMGAMFDAMSSDDGSDGAELFGAGEIEMSMSTWQNFDDYGTARTITAPDAVDRTSELMGLLDS